MKIKPKIFIIFADLDGTFTPMDLEGKIDFVRCVEQIQEQTGVSAKFVPISGRPAGYVLRVLHETREILAGDGIINAADYGAAEQGAVLVNSRKTYDAPYIGNPAHKDVKSRVQQVLQKSPHCKILADEMDKLYTCSIHILNEAKAQMSEAEQKRIFESVHDDLLEEFGPSILDMSYSHNTLEVMTTEISKPHALDILLQRYIRDGFDIVGVLFAGDAQNDLHAIDHVSKLAEIPGGIRYHVFVPANCQPAVESCCVEKWKNANSAASSNRIRKGPQRLFRGITSLIRDELANDTLVGSGTAGQKRSLDDLALISKAKIRGKNVEYLHLLGRNVEKVEVSCQKVEENVSAHTKRGPCFDLN